MSKEQWKEIVISTIGLLIFFVMCMATLLIF